MSELHKFLFDGLPVRGMVVRLTDAWQQMQARRSASGGSPEPVRHLLGQMSAAAALLHANLKFDGRLVLQISGDGPVKLAVAEARAGLALRATATVTGGVEADMDLQRLANPGGSARCALTLDTPGRQPYQGVVPLSGERDLAAALRHHMRQSEQLDTCLVLAADDDVAAGLLIQRLPREGERNLGLADADADAHAGDSDDAFERIAHLATTLTPAELLGLPVDAVLHRLFWQEPLRRLEVLRPHFACTCSRERVRRMLLGLGRAEVDAIVAERGAVQVSCEFCGAQHTFDAVDAAGLFTATPQRAPSSQAIQ